VITAPEESVTVPVMLPEEPTPCAGVTPLPMSRQAHKHIRVLISFIKFPLLAESAGCDEEYGNGKRQK
jgi:hypothetical protein